MAQGIKEILFIEIVDYSFLPPLLINELEC